MDNNDLLSEFLLNNNLSQHVKEPTRIIGKFYEKSNKTEFSKSILDVVIHNRDLISATSVIGCPFSDHRFVSTTINIKTQKQTKKHIIGRNLSKKNIDLITNRLFEANFETTNQYSSIDDKWTKFKDTILNVLNEIAPEKKMNFKNDIDFPWVDVELIETKLARDHSYEKFNFRPC